MDWQSGTVPFRTLQWLGSDSSPLFYDDVKEVAISRSNREGVSTAELTIRVDLSQEQLRVITKKMSDLDFGR